MDDQKLKDIFLSAKTIAVVGHSDDPDKPSYQVARYLKQQGYRVIPINPKCELVLGEKCYADLASAQTDISPVKIDVVDIFRRPEEVGPHVDEAIRIGAKVIWMQEGIEHLDGGRKAAAAGLAVVMNRCMMKEHQRLMQNLKIKTQNDFLRT